MRPMPISALLPLALAPAAIAQIAPNSAHKHAWGENIGWLNFADAGFPAGAQAARLHATYLSGFVWSENAGWINLGDGIPGASGQYTNAAGSDAGINYNPATGLLSGYAWGENIGWINFSGGALATPPNPARFDPVAGRLRGYAWGENIGWINLDRQVTGQFVMFGSGCYANCDQSTTAPALNVNDFICFQSAFAAGNLYANCDQSTTPPVLNVNDFICFQASFAAGCP